MTRRCRLNASWTAFNALPWRPGKARDYARRLKEGMEGWVLDATDRDPRSGELLIVVRWDCLPDVEVAMRPKDVDLLNQSGAPLLLEGL